MVSSTLSAVSKQYDASARPDVAPPSTNRGVQNTAERLVSLGLDWWEGTFPESELGYLRELIGGDWTELDHGFKAFRQLALNGTSVLGYDSKDGRCYLKLTGQSWNNLRCREGWNELAFLADLAARATSVARIDFAVDTFGKDALSLDAMRDAWDAGEVSSRWRSMDEKRAPRKPGEPNRLPSSLYFGSKHSDSQLVAYDKGVQTGFHEPGVHVRLELRWRDQNAEAAQAHILAAGDLAAGVELLAGLIDFKAYRADVNKMRVRSASWWSAFLAGAQKAKMAVGRVTMTIERATKWLYKQAACAIAAIVEHQGGCIDEVLGMIQSGRDRFRPRHRAMIANGYSVT